MNLHAGGWFSLLTLLLLGAFPPNSIYKDTSTLKKMTMQYDHSIDVAQ